MTTLKQRLTNGDLALGSWITLGHPAIPEILARAGYDWLAVDLEHSSMTIGQAEEMIRIASLAGTAPLVRLTSNHADQIKRVMDSGAHGLIVPMVKSPDDVTAALAAMHYPPRGLRGVGLARGQAYGADFQGYRAWLDQEAVCIVQIEHIKAVEQCEAILGKEGVDGYILGPYDLSASMGLAGELDHPRLREAMDQVRETGARLGRPGGLHIVEPDPNRLHQAVGEGYRFLAYSLDIRILDTVARHGVSVGRKGA